MKVTAVRNKTFLKILHFFGLLKDTYHVDDITVKLTKQFSKIEYDRIRSYEETVDDIDFIKSYIYEVFEKDPKLEYRCRCAREVWIYLHKQSNYEASGVLKILFYSKDRVLYYNCKLDMISLNRDIKIKSILGNEDN